MEGPIILTPEQIEVHRDALEQAAALPLSPEARAMALACVAHGRQFRKGSNLPYLTHLIEVHHIISGVPGITEAQRVASILHDYDEDDEFTHARPGDIERWFGSETARHVMWLTKTSRPEDGTRSQRAELDRIHSASVPGATQTIKYGDIYSNARNISQCLPDFARVWLPEKVLQMNVMHNGDVALRQRVMDLLDRQLMVVGLAGVQDILDQHP